MDFPFLARNRDMSPVSLGATLTCPILAALPLPWNPTAKRRTTSSPKTVKPYSPDPKIRRREPKAQPGKEESSKALMQPFFDAFYFKLHRICQGRVLLSASLSEDMLALDESFARM